LEVDLQIPVQDCAVVAHGENDLLVWLQVLADDIEWLALDQRFDLFFEIDLQSTSIIESPNALEAFMIGTKLFLAPSIWSFVTSVILHTTTPHIPGFSCSCLLASCLRLIRP
jgi:hypothetical protein